MKKSLFATAFLAVAASQLGAVAPADAAQIVNNSGSCVDIQHGDTSDGTPMMLFHCHGSPNQNWILTGGTVSGENGVCLDVSGSVPRDGTPIIVVQCNGRSSQKWQVNLGLKQTRKLDLRLLRRFFQAL